MRANLFGMDGLAPYLRPKDMMRELRIRSNRTLDSYVKQPGFPQGRIERFGRMEVRVWTSAELGRAQAWLADHGQGARAGQVRIANLERARTARAEVTELVQLSGRLLRVAGAHALAEALRPLGFDGRGFEQIPLNYRAAARAGIVRALAPHAGWVDNTGGES